MKCLLLIVTNVTISCLCFYNPTVDQGGLQILWNICGEKWDYSKESIQVY